MVERAAVIRSCVWHCCGKELTGRQRRFCSPSCKLKFYVTRRRKSLKCQAVAYKGGCCSVCGYDRCHAALTFHHLDRQKEFGIAAKGYTRSWARVKAELDRCLLVCANCHIEIHAQLHSCSARP